MNGVQVFKTSASTVDLFDSKVKSRKHHEGDRANFLSSQYIKHVIETMEVNGIGKISIPLQNFVWTRLRGVAVSNPSSTNSGKIVSGSVIHFKSNCGADPLGRIKKISANACLQLGINNPQIQTRCQLIEMVMCDATRRETYQSFDQQISDPDHFATLIVQIPVGVSCDTVLTVGTLRQSLNLESQFDNHNFYCMSVFYSDCRFSLVPLRQSRVLALKFALIRTRAVPIPLPRYPKQLDPFRSDAQELKLLLDLWNSTKARKQPRVLVIPLEHKYSQHDSVMDLKGQDRVISDLLRFIEPLKMCLAQLSDDSTAWTEDNGHQPKDLVPYGIPNFSSRNIKLLWGPKMFECHPWIGLTTSLIEFTTLASEYDGTRPICQNSIAEPEMGKRIYESALLLWPENQTEKVRRQVNVLVAWNLLRLRIGAEIRVREGDVEEFRRILTHLCQNVLLLTDDRILQGFHSLCADLNTHLEFVDLLQAVAEFGGWPDSTRSHQIVARLIELDSNCNSGWDVAGIFFYRLAKVDFWPRLGFCASLANALMDRNLSKPFQVLAQQTWDLFASLGSTPFVAKCSLSSVVFELSVMLVRLDKMLPMPKHRVSLLAHYWDAVDRDDIFRLIQFLASTCILVGKNISLFCRELCREAWLFVQTRKFPIDKFASMAPSQLRQLLDLMLVLDDSDLIGWFVSALTRLSREKSRLGESLLQRIFAEGEFANFWLPEEGRRAVAILRAARILELSESHYRVFTWKLPTATVPGHPLVENFLRSEDRSFIYGHFNDVQEAKAFACELEKSLKTERNMLDVRVFPEDQNRKAVCQLLKTRGSLEAPHNMEESRKMLWDLVNETSVIVRPELAEEVKSDAPGTPSNDVHVEKSPPKKRKKSTQTTKGTPGSNLCRFLNSMVGRVRAEQHKKPQLAPVIQWIQDLIDGRMVAKTFVTNLTETMAIPHTRILNKFSTQLKVLRENLRNKTLAIEGIKPPSDRVVALRKKPGPSAGTKTRSSQLTSAQMKKNLKKLVKSKKIACKPVAYTSNVKSGTTNYAPNSTPYRSLLPTSSVPDVIPLPAVDSGPKPSKCTSIPSPSKSKKKPKVTPLKKRKCSSSGGESVSSRKSVPVNQLAAFTVPERVVEKSTTSCSSRVDPAVNGPAITDSKLRLTDTNSNFDSPDIEIVWIKAVRPAESWNKNVQRNYGKAEIKKEPDPIDETGTAPVAPKRPLSEVSSETQTSCKFVKRENEPCPRTEPPFDIADATRTFLEPFMRQFLDCDGNNNVLHGHRQSIDARTESPSVVYVKLETGLTSK